MKPLTREWIGKAEGDLATVRREVQARKAPNYDAACFHAQQCIEKYLKARLQEAEISFAVGVRYPGESADKAMAREALALCHDVRRHIRLSLGLEP